MEHSFNPHVSAHETDSIQYRMGNEKREKEKEAMYVQLLLTCFKQEYAYLHIWLPLHAPERTLKSLIRFLHKSKLHF